MALKGLPSLNGLLLLKGLMSLDEVLIRGSLPMAAGLRTGDNFLKKFKNFLIFLLKFY